MSEFAARTDNPETFEEVLKRARERCFYKEGDSHTYVGCPDCEKHPIMRLDHFRRHWHRKHNPQRDIIRKEAADPKLHVCEDCDYSTTHKSHYTKHIKKGCPRKKREQKANEKAKERQEAHKKADREYQAR